VNSDARHACLGFPFWDRLWKTLDGSRREIPGYHLMEREWDGKRQAEE